MMMMMVMMMMTMMMVMMMMMFIILYHGNPVLNHPVQWNDGWFLNTVPMGLKKGGFI